MYHHMKSKSFMNEFISASADNSSAVNRPIPSTVTKHSKKGQNLIGNSPNMNSVAAPRGPTYSGHHEGVKKKAKVPSMHQSSLKTKMISNSFDKTSGGPQIIKAHKVGNK
jgi:hypothetical protein